MARTCSSFAHHLGLLEGAAVQLSLADRTILVTGGGSGIGKGVATAVVSAGGNAMLVGRNADRLVAAADEIRSAAGDGAGEVRYEPADVTNEDEVSAVVEAATAWHGRLHGVVHCAGGSETIGPITQVDSDAWRRTVDLNVNGSMYVLKHSAREMVRGGGGSFVGISSIAASNTHRWFGAYGVSKSAVDHLMQLGADELGRVLGAGQLDPTRTDPHRTRCRRHRFAGAQRRLPDQHAAAAGRRGHRHRQRGGVPAQRCSRAGSPDRSSTSTAVRCCAGAPTTRRCSNRSSAPTACGVWSASRPGSCRRPPTSSGRRRPTSRGARRHWPAVSGNGRAAGWRPGAAPATRRPRPGPAGRP